MSALDLTKLTDEELEDLRSRAGQEQYSRRCPEFLPRSQSCDQGSAPHDEHGCDTYGHDGRAVRVTWKKKED